MESISNTVSSVKDTLLSQGTTTQSGTEPPNAQQGKGTIESPYDSGNAPVQPVGQGIEPPNAQQGKGTVDSAYDQGNQPENSTPSVPATTQQSSTPSNPQSSTVQTNEIPESRGRTETKPAAPAPSTDSGNFGEAKRDAGLNLERSVSPGQLDDGTHVRTSGAKGQSYEPGNNTMGKLKGKLFGRNKD